MKRLLDCFSALMAFGLALDAAIANAGGEGEVRPPPPSLVPREAAGQRAAELLDQARAAALGMGHPADQVESALFALVAWLDEVLARHPGASGATALLQTRFFNSSNARTEFFHHLSALPAGEQAVREVYWHALALGFKGQYYFESGRGEGGELAKLRDWHGQQLAVRPAALDANPITPQPYATPDPAGPRNPQRRTRALLRAAAVLALAAPLAYLLSHHLSGRLPDGAPAGEAARTPPATSAAAPSLARRVAQQLQTHACADLSAAVSGEGVVRVSGYVPKAETAALVEREVRALPGVTEASFELRARGWPHCEVAEILKPYQTRNRELGLGLKITAPSARGEQLREGDPVRLQVATPDYEGHLWIDYYTADGSVMHIKARRALPRALANGAVEIGPDEAPSSWLVAPPFGPVLLTVLASPTPFSEATERPPFELASAYLRRLRESLAAGEFGARVIADSVFLETAPR